jgi:hypothetical protein
MTRACCATWTGPKTCTPPSPEGFPERGKNVAVCMYELHAGRRQFRPYDVNLWNVACCPTQAILGA